MLSPPPPVWHLLSIRLPWTTRPRHIVSIQELGPIRIARMRSTLSIDQRLKGQQAGLSHIPAKLAFRNRTDRHLVLDHWLSWLLIGRHRAKCPRSPSPSKQRPQDRHHRLVSHLSGPANAPLLLSLAISKFSGEVQERYRSDRSVPPMSRQIADTEGVDGQPLTDPDQMPLHQSCTCPKVPMMDGPNSSLPLGSRNLRHYLKHLNLRHSRTCFTMNC
jgi:hypothetical protein